MIMKENFLLVGAGAIGVAIARRIGKDKKIFIADNRIENSEAVAKTLREIGYDCVACVCDISSRDSIKKMLDQVGEISMFANSAGVTPDRAPKELILKINLYGTAVLLEEVGKAVKSGGTGITITSQAERELPALTPEQDYQLGATATDDLLKLDLLQPENIRDSLHAYQLAKRCNLRRVLSEAVKWGNKKARINAISPGLLVTPASYAVFNGDQKKSYDETFSKIPSGRAGMVDEVACTAEFLLNPANPFITGADILVDGGTTASYFYGPLRPEK